MGKSLVGVLVFMGVLVAVLLLILRQGFWGPVIVLGLAVLMFGVTFLSEFWKLMTGKYSKKPAGNAKKTDGKKV